MTTVAITGVTGNFGHGLIPLLEADPRVRRVIGIGRRPFDPADRGWTKVTYRLLRLPRKPPALEAAEVLTQPVIVDATAAKQHLGRHPRYTALEALRATVRG